MPSLSFPSRTSKSVDRNVGRKIKFLSFLAFLMSGVSANAADLATMQKLPLFSIQNFEYAGGFKFELGIRGESEVAYAQGPIAVGKDGKSIFLAGHAHQQAIGEFNIPALVKTGDSAKFNRATFKQPFRRVLNRTPSGNPQAIDRIGGMALINGELVVNTYVYYDAGTATSHTTLVVKDAANLASSPLAGYHSYSARAHAAGWITPIPVDWQPHLGGTYITGAGGHYPIQGRLSMGPSAFAFDPTNPLLGNLPPSTIQLTKLLDFDLAHTLGTSTIPNVDVAEYMYNRSKNPDMLWTHVSGALLGFIVPGTRTYLTIGNTGGLESGLGYKITQDTGNVCGGHCPYKASDMNNFYWAWDLNDLIKVKNGQMKSYDVRPYAHGKIELPMGYRYMIGGAFDPINGLAYLTLDNGEWNEFGGLPAVVAYKVPVSNAGNIVQPPQPPLNINAQPVSQ